MIHQHSSCYFLHDPMARRVKIGHSTNVEARIAALQTGSASPLVLLGVLPGGAKEEGLLHTLFAEHWVHREWFRAEPEVLHVIRLLLLRQGKPQTAQDELEHRQGCRYGLRGVQIALRDGNAQPWVILHSYWGRGEQLLLAICLPEDFPPAPDPPSRMLTVSTDEMAATEPPASKMMGIKAQDAFLLSEWPIVCRCWCDD